MRVITWNRSFKGLPQQDDARDNFDTEELETHATVLDKMLAWEKKLYDEAKEGELMKIEYHRKAALLNQQRKRGVRPEYWRGSKFAVLRKLFGCVISALPKLVDLVRGKLRNLESMKNEVTKVSLLSMMVTFSAWFNSTKFEFEKNTCLYHLMEAYISGW
ncbi:hypothetical protein ACMD2_19847, partial [Ananas comosus]